RANREAHDVLLQALCGIEWTGRRTAEIGPPARAVFQPRKCAPDNGDTWGLRTSRPRWFDPGRPSGSLHRFDFGEEGRGVDGLRLLELAWGGREDLERDPALVAGVALRCREQLVEREERDDLSFGEISRLVEDEAPVFHDGMEGLHG